MGKYLYDQSRAPIYEALERFREMRVVPFDVPGHKHGKGNPELTAFLGEKCVGVDVNSMKPACCAWRMRPTEPTSTSATACR